MRRPPARRAARTRRRSFARAEHLCVDVRERALYWVRASASGSGLVPRASGVVPLDPGRERDEQLRALFASGFGAGMRLELALDCPVLLERADLPAMSAREALAVARRRLGGQGPGDHEPHAVFLRSRGGGEAPVWRFIAQAVERDIELERWRALGADPHRLSSRHAAIANLARLVGVPEGRTLAFFDLGTESGLVVIADAHGWLFSREVPLRFMGDRLVRARDDEANAEPMHPPSADADGELDPLELASLQSERVDTELRRTMQYVQSELRIDPVARVILTGEIPELPQVARALAVALPVPVALLGDAIASGPLAGGDPGAAVAMGLALAIDAEAGNLLPPAVLAARARRRTRRRLATALAASGLVAGALLGAGALRVQAMRSEAARLASAWSLAAPMRERVESALAARRRAAGVEAAHAAIDGREPAWSALLETLARTAPNAFAVHRLSMRREEEAWGLELVVEARAPTMAEAAGAVAEFSEALGRSPFVRVGPARREELPAGRDVTDEVARVGFRIDGRVAPVAAPPSAAEPAEAGGDV